VRRVGVNKTPDNVTRGSSPRQRERTTRYRSIRWRNVADFRGFLAERVTLKIQRRSAGQCRQKFVPRLRILRHFLACTHACRYLPLPSPSFSLSPPSPSPHSPARSPSPRSLARSLARSLSPAASPQGLLAVADGPRQRKSR